MRKQRNRAIQTDTPLSLPGLNCGGRMITGSKVRLCDKSLADAPNDYAWKTDPDLARLDATPPPTTSFTEYQLSYAEELHHPPPAKCQFAILTLDGKHIGNCACYDIDEKKGEAELGIMIGNRNYWSKGYGTDAVTTLVSHIFAKTDLKRIYLKTLESNHRAQKCFNKCGFIPYGRRVTGKHIFLMMEIYRTKWQESQVETCSALSPWPAK